jgi:hypothetical protein
MYSSQKDYGFLKYYSFFKQNRVKTSSFNFLHNKRIVMQKGLFLKFYIFKNINTLILFMDNCFWQLLSFKELFRNFKIQSDCFVNQNFFFKKKSFFFPFFIQENFFFFKIPFQQVKISLKIFSNHLKKKFCSFLGKNQFFKSFSFNQFCFLRAKNFYNFYLQRREKKKSYKFFFKSLLDFIYKKSFFVNKSNLLFLKSFKQLLYIFNYKYHKNNCFSFLKFF